MQARGQITLLTIVTAVMSIIHCLKSSSLLPVGDASTSVANKKVEKADAYHRKKRGTYHHYDDEIQTKIAKY